MNSQLTDEERDQLREMLRDFDRARYVRAQLKWGIIWLLGLPAAAASIITALSKIAEWWRH